MFKQGLSFLSSSCFQKFSFRCVILTVRAYETCRRTEIPECDTFVCEKRVLGDKPFEKSCCSLLQKGYENNRETNPGNALPMDLENARNIKKLRVSFFFYNFDFDSKCSRIGKKIIVSEKIVNVGKKIGREKKGWPPNW